MSIVLVVSPVPTHPTTAGNRARINNMLELLRAEGHIIHFLYTGTLENTDQHAMKDAWHECFFLPNLKPKGFKWFAKLIKNFFKINTAWLDYKIWKINAPFIAKLFKPYKVDDWYNPAIDNMVRVLQEKHTYDVLLVEYVFLSRAFDLFGGKTLKVLDTHDVYANRHLMFVKQGKIPHFFYTTREQESIGLNRADVVVAIQRNECDYFSQVCEKKCIVIGHVCKPKKLEVNVIQETVKLLFIGNGAAPNLGALDFLSNQIFNELKKQKINFECDIVGDIPVPEGKLVEEFNFIGIVEDLESCYKKADIVLNPVQIGTGLNIKSIEAISYGKPLITTNIGAKGLAQGEDTSFLVADNEVEFAQEVSRLVSNPSLYRALSKQAFVFSKKYNKDVVSTLTDFLIK